MEEKRAMVKGKSFEEAIAELEGIVRKLEKGDLPLEESIEIFKNGVELSGYLSTKLSDAERKITILLENDKGEINENAFLREE
jgi:exodeoxyribonuclease VII small subunit